MKTETPTAEVTLHKGALPVAGDWTRAKALVSGAEKLERLKTWTLVMLGFELIALKKQHGVVSGKHSSSNTMLEEGAKPKSWGEMVEEQIGKSEMTAWRYMDMAEKSKSKLLKLPELKTLPLFEKSINEFTPKQLEALEKGTRKITDGKTQAEFALECGTMKAPQGSGAKGGDKGKKEQKLTTAQAMKLACENANESWGTAASHLTASNRDFFLCCVEPQETETVPDNDLIIEAQISVLENALNARRKWLKTPKAKRDPKILEEFCQ